MFRTVNTHFHTLQRMFLSVLRLIRIGNPVKTRGMGKGKQQSIPEFDDDEQRLIEQAMKIDAIRAQGVWVRSAAVKWARHVIAMDAGLLERVEQARQRSSTD